MGLAVATYNVHEGGGDRLARIAEVIQSADVDAVALTEVTPRAVDVLARTLALHPTFGESNSVFDLHVAWLTRRPVAQARNHRMPELSKTLLEIRVGGLSLFATHLASRHEEAAHPRAGEVAAILAVLGRTRGPHLLAGDLNALRPGDPVGTPPEGVAPRGEALPGTPRPVLDPLADAGYADCFRRLHPSDPGSTYRADAPWLRIDYVWASPGLAARLAACEVVDTSAARLASDHLPVVARFA